MPFVQETDYLSQRFLDVGVLFLFRQRFQRFHEGKARFHQGQQFLAEKHQRKARLALPLPLCPGWLRLDRKDGITLGGGLACCISTTRTPAV